ncbi:hypothetical protein P152DRAFT_202628 [Eremomyces bilateralis CBS 781.70]|uniref:Tat pathway signal sequence n=1 Tax=Eremomyces bilateralis CBS 781.70 TaxID=1392243 RepID=A0A6G1GCX4_9PEZI|nr:uncharacterized protein P152DRAFT_202628 [Eremomyces bilateralis CBS 781.70]KAF1815938.1 hypothetical protein P152DRAFT_202628 [Eremomyces bilateralis CBS 781.70]
MAKNQLLTSHTKLLDVGEPSLEFLSSFVFPLPLGSSLQSGVTLVQNTMASISAPSGSITTVMKYNRTFSDPPSEDTSQAWNGIYPKGVGFVQHPTLAPEPSGLSVFHQLHCLDALRIAYYTALQGHPSHPTSHADHNEHDDPHHVRHCFDYIRQSLMCHADTNLEPVDPKLGGTTGWGSPKTCRDYHSVKQWAKHWMARKE